MKVSMLMKEYIDSEDRRAKARHNGLLPESFCAQSMPVEVIENHWSVLESPERLARKYTFNNLEQRSHFLNELFAEEASSGHFAKTTIEGHEVLVEVWTHDIDRVTELDQELAALCDDFYNDAKLVGVIRHVY